MLQGFCELTTACDPESVVALPARDVLPFQNLSPHPELQEERATALWKIATGKASIVVSPVAATAILQRSADYYADLARMLRRGESFDVETLLAHLNTVGYTSADVVEMPGEYALRGGILDVYSPEAERPVRIEFFGDEVESIRRFDPASQRSSNPMDEALLLPLTETPVSDHLLGAIHTRLSGKRITGNEEIVEAAVRSGGVTVFPGWEFYAPVAGADRTVFDLLPHAAVLLDEPDLLRTEFDRFWTRVEEAHERSGVGNLVRPDGFVSAARRLVAEGRSRSPERDVEHLGITRSEDDELRRHFPDATHAALPRRGSRRCWKKSRSSLAQGNQVLFSVPNTGEVERLADIFTEYNVSFRLGSRTRGGESYADETSYFAGEVLTTTLAKAYVPDGVLFPRSAPRHLRRARSVRRIRHRSLAPAAPEIESLRIPLRLPRPAGRRLRRPRRARHRPVPGPERNQSGRRQRRVHVARIRRGRAPLRPAHAPRPDSEIPFVRRREARRSAISARRPGPRPRPACARP